MANAYQCDKCGEFFKGEPRGHVTIKWEGKKEWDLCPKCVRFFFESNRQEMDSTIERYNGDKVSINF